MERVTFVCFSSSWLVKLSIVAHVAAVSASLSVRVSLPPILANLLFVPSHVRIYFLGQKRLDLKQAEDSDLFFCHATVYMFKA